MVGGGEGTVEMYSTDCKTSGGWGWIDRKEGVQPTSAPFLSFPHPVTPQTRILEEGDRHMSW